MEKGDKTKKTFALATLGCRTNQYETEAYRTQLLKMGFIEAKEDEKADLCIVNTCTVTHQADQRSRNQLKTLIKKHPDSRVLATGCSVEREAEAILAVDPKIELIANKDKEKLLEKVFVGKELPEFAVERFDAHTRAFLKIQDGCNSFCSYCIIPYVRGRSRSKTLPQIVSEAKALIENGYKEIVITGINVGDFDGGVKRGETPIRLHEVVKAIDKLPGIERIRISSIDPDEVDDDLLDAVINGIHTCPSMHIVLQAGSNTVLKRMNRKYTKQQYFYAVDRLKGASKDFTFTTDIIVGFPGESERDFEETLDVMKEVRFAKVHMFPFSARPRTKAAKFEDQISKEVIDGRRQILLRLAEKTAFELREDYVGRTMKVLLENDDKMRDGYISGHTENFLLVTIPRSNYKPNDIVEVKCINNHPDGIVGQCLP